MASNRYLFRLASLALLVPLTLLSSQGSTEEIAPINVSLAIQQVCVVQSTDDAAAARPDVSCLHGEAYDVSRTMVDTASAPSKLRMSSARTGATVWTVTF
jgi:hypothetical protein